MDPEPTPSPPPRSRTRSLRTLIVDIGPIRESHGLRWLFIGQAASFFSRQVLVVAVPFQVFSITNSSAMVGLVGLAQVLPLIGGAFLGGVAADALDRRRVLVVVQGVMGLTTIGLAIFTIRGGTSLLPVFLLISLNAAAAGIDSPARHATIPTMVKPGQLPAAFALHATLIQMTQVVGPAVGGLVIAGFGLAVTYWMATAGFLLAAVALIPLGSQRTAGENAVNLAAFTEGWRYFRSVPLLEQTMLIDLNAMVFGMPRALFPAIGLDSLDGTAATVGLLFAAPGVGALIGAMSAGWVSGVRRQGRAVVYAVVAWGLAITGFGLTHTTGIALALLAFAGAADVVSNIFRNAIIQSTVPDALRGRIAAFKTSLAGGGPRLGDAEAGVVAALTTPAFAVVSGGLASVIGAVLIGWRGRAIWGQSATDIPTPPFVADPMTDSGVG